MQGSLKATYLGGHETNKQRMYGAGQFDGISH